MIAHERFRELAALQPEFELAPDERAEYEAHLADCEPCRRYAAALAHDAELLKALPKVDAPEWVGQRLRARSARRALPGWLAPAAAVAVVIVAPLAIAGLFLGGLRLDGFNFCPGCSSGAAGTPVPAATEPGGSAAPPLTGFQLIEVSVPAGARAPLAFASVARGTDGFVAVGTACATERSSPDCAAAVATSVDGVDWVAVRSDSAQIVDPLRDGSPAGMRDVVPGGPGYVAVGATGGDAGSEAVAWTSNDGRSWRRSEIQSDLGAAWMNAVAATADGTLVAVGGVATPAGVRAAAWISADGVTWRTAPDGPEMDLGGSPGRTDQSGMVDVMALFNGSLIAVGATCSADGATCDGTAWSSADGLTWIRVEGRPFEDGLPAALAERDGIVTTVGRRGGSPAAWVTEDGRTWNEAAVNPGGVRGELLAVTAFRGFLAAGAFESADAGSWIADEGADWFLQRDPALEGGIVLGILAADDHIVAVGTSDDGSRGLIWVRAAEGSAP